VTNINFAGISSPIGIIFFGDRHRVTVREPLQLKGIKIHRGDAKITIRKTGRSNPIYLPIGILLTIDLMMIAYCVCASVSIPVKFSHSLADGILTAACMCGIAAFIHLTRGYHGAEHKVIAAAENGEVDLAKVYSPIHPRCGTNLFPLYFILVVASSLLFYPLFGAAMGMSYMVMRRTSPIQRMFEVIGGVFQRLTTTEPTDRELNNAILGMRALLDAEGPLAVAQ